MRKTPMRKKAVLLCTVVLCVALVVGLAAVARAQVQCNQYPNSYPQWSPVWGGYCGGSGPGCAECYSPGGSCVTNGQFCFVMDYQTP